MSKKTPGPCTILTSVIVTLTDESRAKVVFVRDRRKKDWLALLSTDIHLPDEDVFESMVNDGTSKCSLKWPSSILKLAKRFSVGLRCPDRPYHHRVHALYVPGLSMSPGNGRPNLRRSLLCLLRRTGNISSSKHCTDPCLRAEKHS